MSSGGKKRALMWLAFFVLFCGVLYGWQAITASMDASNAKHLKGAEKAGKMHGMPAPAD